MIGTGGVPKDLAVWKDVVVLVNVANEVIVIKAGEKKSTKVDYSTTAVDVCAANIAVGGEDGKVRLYSLDMKCVGELIGNRGIITAISYSPDGKLVAVGDTDRKILVFDTATKQITIDGWVFHSARINSLEWSPDGKHVVSTSLDTNVEVWSLASSKHISIKGAHGESAANAVWLGNDTIVSVGGDAAIKGWSIVQFE